jgi:hypothetical protein
MTEEERGVRDERHDRRAEEVTDKKRDMIVGLYRRKEG